MTFISTGVYNAKLREVARRYLGHTETALNSSPLIDEWLGQVKQAPGASWCAAACHAWAGEAASFFDKLNPCPRTASVLRMWELCQRMRVPTPSPGCLGFADHGGGKGHVFIVDACSASGFLQSLSGNTTADTGSREGNAVATHEWDWLLGLAGAQRIHGGRLLGFADLEMGL